MENRKRNFVGYDYKEIYTSSEQASFLIDVYENFGWEMDQNIVETSPIKYNKYALYNKNVILRMKRDRKILNKMELTRLQRNFESCIKEIETLERSKSSIAQVYSLVIGIVGTAFMAGSVFAVTATPPHIIACIILAVPGFLGWIFPYFVYKKMVKKQTEKVTPYIEAKYDEIYEICEKGSKLL